MRAHRKPKINTRNGSTRATRRRLILRRERQGAKAKVDAAKVKAEAEAVEAKAKADAGKKPLSEHLAIFAQAAQTIQAFMMKGKGKGQAIASQASRPSGGKGSKGKQKGDGKGKAAKGEDKMGQLVKEDPSITEARFETWLQNPPGGAHDAFTGEGLWSLQERSSPEHSEWAAL